MSAPRPKSTGLFIFWLRTALRSSSFRPSYLNSGAPVAIYVMSDGRIRDELRLTEFDEKRILAGVRWAYGAACNSEYRGSAMIVGISEKAGVVPGQDDGRSTRVAFIQRYGREVGLPVIVIVMAIFFDQLERFSFAVEFSGYRGFGGSARSGILWSDFRDPDCRSDLSVGAIVALVSIIGALIMRDHGIAAGLAAPSWPAPPSASSTKSSLHASRFFRSSRLWR